MASTTVLAASAARTASGEEVVVDTLPNRQYSSSKMRFYLNVTAHAGTSPTLDVDIVKEVGGVDIVLASFAQVTTTDSVTTVTLDFCPDDVKALWTITGSAGQSFTFAVTGDRF